MGREMISDFQSGPRKHASGLSNGRTVPEGRESSKSAAYVFPLVENVFYLYVILFVKKLEILCYKLKACFQRYRKTRKMRMELSKRRPN